MQAILNKNLNNIKIIIHIFMVGKKIKNNNNKVLINF